MSKCRYCGQEIPAEALKIGESINRAKAWHVWRKGDVAEVQGVGFVECLERFVNDEERSHGGDQDAVMIFLVDGVLFRKLGTTNSYGETTWDAAFAQVIPKTKNVKEWQRT